MQPHGVGASGLAVAAAHSVAEAGQAHGVAERDVSAAASSSGQGGAALGGAEVEEPAGASSELTEDVLAAVQAAVQQEKQYMRCCSRRKWRIWWRWGCVWLSDGRGI